jgi:lipopolysaccharide/colanic/teichoic acid biosynthesis glycosyltransferase
VGPEGALLDMKVEYPSASRSPEFRSAGVYLIERSALALIPDDIYYDLKEQFIPEVLKSGRSVRIHPLQSYQHELNSIEDYLSFHFDLCRGRTGSTALGEEIMEGIHVQGPVDLPPDVMLVGPMILGEGVRIGARCRLIGPLVIGKNARIGDGVFLREAVIGENVTLGNCTRVERSIIEGDQEVKEDAQISESVTTSHGLQQGSLNLVERDLRVGVASMTFSKFVRAHAKRGFYSVFKRLFDIMFATAALILSLPLMAVVALAILSDSGWPVLFRQRRCGKKGKEFNMMKFRSMRADAAEIRARIGHLNECDGPVFKISNDPRFTRIGRILRKYSLDEIPQLWNVLRGDMSVVGPRPLAESELRTCPSWREARLQVKPGLTGLWQVSSREKKSFHDWILHDLRYVRDQSFLLDMSILVRTLTVLARGY